MMLLLTLLLTLAACGRGDSSSSGSTTALRTGTATAGGNPTYGATGPGLVGHISTTTAAADGPSGTAPASTAKGTKTVYKTVQRTVKAPTKAPATQPTAEKTPGAVSSPARKSYRFTVPVLTGDKSKQLQKNANRGFRLENYMSVENGQYTPELYDENGRYKGSVGTLASGKLLNFYYDYEYEAPQVAQTYFYLTQYRGKDLDQKAIDNMNAYFEVCRQTGITVALRFAYVFNMGCDATQDCVSLDQMQRHMQQLKPVLAKNRDVLFCLEAGFFGQWGEQTPDCSWNRNGQVGAIIHGCVAMVPEDLWVVVRYAWVRETAGAAAKARIGYHNDYIVGVSHAWDSGTEWSTDTYRNLVALSPRVLVEGEMPWGGQLPFAIDGWNVATYLQANHYTVLSCYHNNREGGNIYDMKKWRSVPVSAAALAGRGLRCYDAWFRDSSGKAISRSLFDYIQDFLGYHVVASDAAVEKNGTKVTASFSLTNYGFAAPLAMKQLRLVLLDSDGRIAASQTICPLADLQAGKKRDVSLTLTTPHADQVYRLGVFLEAPSGTGAKLANDLAMVGGVNILGTLN